MSMPSGNGLLSARPSFGSSCRPCAAGTQITQIWAPNIWVGPQPASAQNGGTARLANRQLRYAS